jgi:uncharacterized protein
MRGSRLALADGTSVAAALHEPASVPATAVGAATVRVPAPVLLLPGARGDHAAAPLVAAAEVLAASGHHVVRSALTDRAPGIGAAGPTAQAVARVAQVLAAARRTVDEAADGRPWIVGGMSFGGRVASMAVAEHGGAALGVVGVLALAYPLHPPGRPDRLRVAHWPSVDVPMLLLCGDADPFAQDGSLARQLPALAGGATLVLVAGAGHDLAVMARRAPDGRRSRPEATVARHAGALRDWAADVSG